MELVRMALVVISQQCRVLIRMAQPRSSWAPSTMQQRRVLSEVLLPKSEHTPSGIGHLSRSPLVAERFMGGVLRNTAPPCSTGGVATVPPNPLLWAGECIQ